MKIVYILENWGFGVEFLDESFFVVNGIDIHQLNLGPFRNKNLLDEIPFKKCVSWHLFTNKCIINKNERKNHYHIKKEEILYMDITLFFQFSFV